MTERNPGARTTDEWVRAAESRLGLGFWFWDVATAKLVCSAGLYTLAGVNPAGVQLDLGFLESLVHPGDRLVVDSGNGLAVDPRQANRQFRIIRPDGQLRWLHSQASSFFDRNGEVTRVVAVLSDVTEQREIRARLANKRALLHNISALIDGTLWISDEQGRLLDLFSANGVAPGLGIDEEGSNWRAGMHPDDLERQPEIWRHSVERKKPYHFAPRLRLTNGQYLQFHIAGLPFSPEHSSEPNWGGVATPNANAISTRSSGGDNEVQLTPAQVRACRALLDWTAETLAQNAGISISTVRRIESAEAVYGQGDSLRLVTLAFREAGLKIWHGEDGRFCISDRG